jgi:Zn-dependent alcohol dehydrogenase
VPKKDDEFKTHPMNFLNERTLKGAFYGNYKPRTDIPAIVEKYMNKVTSHFFLALHSSNQLHEMKALISGFLDKCREY